MLSYESRGDRVTGAGYIVEPESVGPPNHLLESPVPKKVGSLRGPLALGAGGKQHGLPRTP